LSGLAAGIDASAHRGALAGGGFTAAVLGTGIDIVYPSANAELAAAILAADGALVSEFEDGTPPRRVHFPRRNWTLAGLVDCVVVVEAGEGSGALITAEAAAAMNKEVLAVPGSVFSPLSVGCHQLIRDGAGLVQNARDVLSAVGEVLEVLDDPLGSPAGEPVPTGGRDALLQHLSDVLPQQPEDLARRLSLPFPEVVGRLAALEMEGSVRSLAGGFVRLTSRSSGH
jgi:DNA processing protein